jgi:mRNA-degrading endonuclease RelE of RelBE toxin-antitoxin system
MPYEIWIPWRVEKQIAGILPKLITRVLDDLERFADALDYKRYDVRKLRDSPKAIPRYRMRSGNYRITFFIHHKRLVIEVISIRRKKTGMDY